MRAAPILIGVVGSVLLGVVALIVAPLLYAVTQPSPQGLAIFTAHTLIVSMPMFLLRERALPSRLLDWAAALPIRGVDRIKADAWASATLMAPLCAAYLFSALAWAWQSPKWLQSVWFPALAAVLLSALCTALFGVLILHLRWRAHGARGRSSPPATVVTAAATWPTRAIRSAHRIALVRYLLWLPLWRQKSLAWHAGQLMLIVLIGAGFVAMLWHPVTFKMQAGVAPLSALLLVGLTLWRDAAMQKNLSHLISNTAAWPIPRRALKRAAVVWAAWPPAALSLGLIGLLASGEGTIELSAVWWFAAIALAGAPMVLAFTHGQSRGRWAAAAIWLGALLISGGQSSP